MTDHTPNNGARQCRTTRRPRSQTPAAARKAAEREAARREESWRYWGEICAQMPPMTREQIETVAAVLRRIDARQAHQDTDHDEAA